LNKKRLKVERLDLTIFLSVVDVDSLSKLEDLQVKDEFIMEDDEAFYLLKGRMAFRVIKKEAKPRIINTLNFQASPDSFSAKVELEPKALLALAVKQRLPIFYNQASQEYLVPSELFLFAKRQKEKQ